MVNWNQVIVLGMGVTQLWLIENKRVVCTYFIFYSHEAVDFD